MWNIKERGLEGPKRCVTSSRVAMRDLKDVQHQVGWSLENLKRCVTSSRVAMGDL